jgi:flavin-dependent dehydrogenase
MTDYDVVVAGAGPAGAACATLLARNSLRVLLVDGGVPSGRPTEVFAPDTLRLIRQLGITCPDRRHRARDCRGTLSAWAAGDEDFYDYRLYACEAAIAVDRHAYDAALVAGAQSAGADVVGGRLSGSERTPAGWNVFVGARQVRGRLLVDATGRNGRAAPAHIPAPRFRDRLLSFAFPCSPALNGDVLLLEAVRDGWWYASPRVGQVNSLVFLSDSDLVPRQAAARAARFRASFDATRLIRRHCPVAPDFDQHRGRDARTGARRRVAGRSWLAIGDAALSVDPLSGDGTRLAFESAQQAAAAAIRFARNGDEEGLADYAAWCRDTEQRLLLQRRSAYAAVDPAFRHELFWRRRL